MDFIKKHYEKVILLGLFLIFIGLMFLVQSVINSTREVKDSDLKLPPRQPDYINEDNKDAKFNTQIRWMSSNFKWNSLPAVADNGEPSNDLVSPFQMAECSNCSKIRGRHYTMLIPLAHFNSKDESFNKCPECGVDLYAPLMIDVPELERKYFQLDSDYQLLITMSEALHRESEERIKQEEEQRQKEEEQRQREEEALARQNEEENKQLEQWSSDLAKEAEEESARLTEIASKLHQEEEALSNYEFTRLTEISGKLHQEEEALSNFEFERLTTISNALHQELIVEISRMEEIFGKVHAEEAERQRAEDEKDRDDDGIPNDEETKYGMDPDDPNDVRYDNDGDGFGNLFEIRNGFRPDDPKNHPPLWWRLQIKDIRRIELTTRFMALNDNASSDKSTWLLQFNYPDPRRKGRTSSSYLQIGSYITIDGRRYKIDDVERIITEKKREAGNLDDGKTVVDKIDESKVFLTEEVTTPDAVPDKLVMTINQTAYSNDMRPALVDGGNIRRKTERVLKIGEKITLTLFQTENKEGGLTAKQRKAFTCVYQLVSVDANKNIITMIEVTPGKELDGVEPFTVRGTGKVPVDMTPIKKVERNNHDVDDGPALRAN